MKQEIFAGLDVGSGRVLGAVAVKNPETEVLEVTGHSSAACRGIRGGVVVNIAEASRIITQVVEDMEEQIQQTIGGIYLGVRGGHLQTFNNRGAYNIARTDKEITAEDVQAVIENAKAIPISNDREILHVIPQGFSLDRQKGVPNPVGMEGTLLEVEVHIVTASSSHLNNLFKAVNEAGFQVNQPVYSLLGTGELVVSQEEKELGSLLIDFGGQTVGVLVYAEGSVRFSKELSLGSDLITRDLAYGLRTSIPVAQQIREKYGAASSSMLNGEEDVEFVGMDGRTTRKIKRRTLVEIIQPRVEEIFSFIGDELQNCGYADVVVPGGAILTGEGALLHGIPEAAEQILGMPVRLGLPRNDLHGPQEILTDPSYAAVLGLFRFGGMLEWGLPMQRKKSVWKRKISSIFEDLF